MPPLSGLRVAIAGCGVFGLSIAAVCARVGAKVTLFEPRRLGDSASGVAAGMLAPAFEAVLEQSPAADHARLQQGYAAWPAFLARLGLGRPHDLAAGALYVGPEDDVAFVHRALAALGVAAERLNGADARKRQPWLGGRFDQALYVGGEGRLDPVSMLRDLEQSAVRAGAELRREALTLEIADRFEAVVLAAGFESRAWCGRASELAKLQPIKGHVLHFAGGLISGSVVRSRAGYAAPQSSGAVFGATMEVGRSDLGLDPHAVRHLRRDALTLFPQLAQVAFTPLTGVRASTPDGRPMVGRTESGLYVAPGARRDGWLLAPVAAEAMVEVLQGGAPDPAFDPARFTNA